MSADQAHTTNCELASEVIRTSGHLRLKVTGWSMLPTVRPGDIIVIDQTDVDRISSGDIVLFRRDQRLFVHRVVRKNTHGQIITQGDSMPRVDPPVNAGDLLGKVSSITRAEKSVRPGRMGLSARAVAALVRRSTAAARVITQIHNFRRSQSTQVPSCLN